MILFDEIRRITLSGYHPLLQAAIDFANLNGYALPSLNWLNILNELIGSLETVILKHDVFYIFIGDGSDGFKTINIAGNHSYNGSIVGGSLTGSLQGYRGTATSYLSTNFNPFTNLASANQKYKAINANRFTIVFLSTPNGRIDGPADGSGANNMINGNVDYQRINQAGNNSAPLTVDLSGTGLKSLGRTNGLAFVATNKNVVTPVNVGGSIVTNSIQNVFRYQGTNSTVGLSTYGMGSYITEAEIQWVRSCFNVAFQRAGLSQLA